MDGAVSSTGSVTGSPMTATDRASGNMECGKNSSGIQGESGGSSHRSTFSVAHI